VRKIGSRSAVVARRESALLLETRDCFEEKKVNIHPSEGGRAGSNRHRSSGHKTACCCALRLNQSTPFPRSGEKRAAAGRPAGRAHTFGLFHPSAAAARSLAEKRSMYVYKNATHRLQ